MASALKRPAIRERLRAWAWRVRHESNAVIIRSMPLPRRWRLYAAVAITPGGPRMLARYLSIVFRRWTVLPGDHWTSVLLGAEGIVREVRTAEIVMEVATHERIAAYAPAWPDERSPIVAVELARIPRDDPYWSPT